MLRCSWALPPLARPRPALQPSASACARPRPRPGFRPMRWRGMAAAAVLALAAAGCTGGETPAPEPAPAAGGPAWRELAAAPSPRTEVAAAAVGRRIWVLGGYGPDGATLATVEVY